MPHERRNSDDRFLWVRNADESHLITRFAGAAASLLTEFALILLENLNVSKLGAWTGSQAASSWWSGACDEATALSERVEQFISRGGSWTCDAQTDGHSTPAGPEDHHKTLKSDDTVAVKVLLFLCWQLLHSPIMWYTSVPPYFCRAVIFQYALYFVPQLRPVMFIRTVLRRVCLSGGLWSRCVQRSNQEVSVKHFWQYGELMLLV